MAASNWSNTRADTEVAHWRYFYQLHKEGKLEAEYERVIGSAYFEALRKDGFIIPDVTIPNFFKNINS